MLNKIKFKNKLTIMLLLPLAGLLFFSINNIVEKYNESEQMASLNALTQLSNNISALVHETQKERGNTAGFLGSQGKSFVTELNGQRELTDAEQDKLKVFLESFDSKAYGSEFNGYLNKALSSLNGLGTKREDVSSFDIKLGDAIAYYTKMNDEFLSVIGFISKISDNAEIATITSSYVNFLYGKERAGIERAVMSSAFAVDSFSAGVYDKFSKMVVEQNTYTSVFMTYASNDQKSFYNDKMSAKEVSEIEEMRATARGKFLVGGFGIDAKYWFKTITIKINLLKDVENKLAKDLENKASVLKSEADKSLWSYLILTVIIVFIAILLGVLIARNILKQLGGEPAVVVEMAEKIAQGDLTMDFGDNSKNTGLYKAMVDMSDKLKDVISSVIESANGIATASTEMSSASQQMSSGATEQASNAEEISSSMEEIAANIQQNTDNSKQTEKIAQQAAIDIDNGSKSVNETVASMKTIASKISIIGEIARQTNLLALNAAVEAARAGEHGKGFAVVAAEVRRLAERSQNAASEIDEVSSSSVEVAQRSGELLERIVPDIQKTANLVLEISAASVEQNSGADQVNNAIQQLNNVVQQNAASAEEMAANSEELNGQADGLKGIVSFFRIQANGNSTKRNVSRNPNPSQNIGRKSVTKPTSSNGKTGAAISLSDSNKASDAADSEYEKF